MDTVSDRIHPSVRRRIPNTNTDLAPELATDPAVLLTHGISRLCTAQREDSHAEVLRLAVRVTAAEGHEFVTRQAKLLAIIGEVCLNQLGRECVIASRYRRMCGVNAVVWATCA